MLDKLLIVIWFLLRPKFYLHFFSLIKRQFLFNYDTTKHRKEAYEWAKNNSLTYVQAMKKIGFVGELTGLDKKTIKEAKELSEKTKVKMGGPGHIHLLYDSVKLLKAKRVIETGVAYGWSSLAILKAFNSKDNHILYSVDMPYPNKNNENYVGIVVPNYLKKNWKLIRKPDRPGIKEALAKIGGKIDLCHYDSDKSWWGRDYAYPILWNSLNPKGLFISDDIQDNLYFSQFTKQHSLNFAVIEFEGKFVGLIRKL